MWVIFCRPKLLAQGKKAFLLRALSFTPSTMSIDSLLAYVLGLKLGLGSNSMKKENYLELSPGIGIVAPRYVISLDC